MMMMMMVVVVVVKIKSHTFILGGLSANDLREGNGVTIVMDGTDRKGLVTVASYQNDRPIGHVVIRPLPLITTMTMHT